MHFLVDTQLPKSLAVWLRARGHEAEHVLEAGLAQSKDNSIWEHANGRQAVVMTKDEDFAEWVRRGRHGPAVVWLRIGNASTRKLLAWLEPLLPIIVVKVESGERLIEVR